ncbi:MAG: branched-chain amino acid ABC transporter permease [Spirochaetales bacterium]
MADILRILFNSLQTGSTYALAALGIALIWKTSRTTNFAQGSIGTLNAYVAGVLLLSWGWSIWLVAIASMVTAFLTGVLIDTFIIRPAAKVSPISKQIITLGLIMVIVGLIPLLFGVDPYRLPSFIPSASVTIAGATLRWNTVFVIAISLALMGFLFWFIQKTRWGLAIRVTAASETTARLMGVPTRTVTMISWASAAMMGTLAALIVAPQASVNPNMLLDVQVSAFFAGVLGGFSTFAGPVLGAFIIAFTRNSAAFYISDIWGNVIVYSSILVFLYFKPYGLLGKKPVKKV